MNLNYDYFEEGELARVAECLADLKEKRKILEIEMSNFVLEEQYIPRRKKIAYGRIINGLLTILIIGFCLFGLSYFPKNIVLRIISIVIIVVGVIITLVNSLRLLVKTPNGLTSKFYLEQEKINLGKSSISYLSSKMDSEIIDLQKKLEQLELLEISEETIEKTTVKTTEDTQTAIKDTETKEKSLGDKSTFSLKAYQVDEHDKREIKKELKSDIEKIRIKIEENYNKINDCRHNMVEIDYNYNKMKKEIMVCVVIIAILECGAIFVIDGVREILTLCSICIVIFFTAIGVVKYRHTIFDYIFERNDKLFKDYAFCNDLVSNRNKIKILNEEINEMLAEIEEKEIKISSLGNKNIHNL